MTSSFICGSNVKHQDKWWHSYGLYFTVVPRRALLLQGLRVPLGGGGLALPSEDTEIEMYTREGKLEDICGAAGWNPMENATFSLDKKWLEIRFEIPVIAQMPLSFYLFSPSAAIIPSYVPNIHAPFPGKSLNDLFSEGPTLRVLVGRWGPDTRFEIYCQDRRGFRGELLYTPRTL